jgi:hypothetical protein
VRIHSSGGSSSYLCPAAGLDLDWNGYGRQGVFVLHGLSGDEEHGARARRLGGDAGEEGRGAVEGDAERAHERVGAIINSPWLRTTAARSNGDASPGRSGSSSSTRGQRPAAGRQSIPSRTDGVGALLRLGFAASAEWDGGRSASRRAEPGGVPRGANHVRLRLNCSHVPCQVTPVIPGRPAGISPSASSPARHGSLERNWSDGRRRWGRNEDKVE